MSWYDEVLLHARITPYIFHIDLNVSKFHILFNMLLFSMNGRTYEDAVTL